MERHSTYGICQTGYVMYPDFVVGVPRKSSKKKKLIIIVCAFIAVVVTAIPAYNSISWTIAMKNYNEDADNYVSSYDNPMPIELELERYYWSYYSNLSASMRESRIPRIKSISEINGAWMMCWWDYDNDMKLYYNADIHTEGDNTHMTLRLAGIRYYDGTLDTGSPAADSEYEVTWGTNSYDDELYIDLSSPNGYRIHLYNLFSFNGQKIMDGYVEDDNNPDMHCGVYMLQ